MLRVSSLEAGYGGSQVLHAISLEVRDGEAVIVLGPNGHGKSTLLRAISGLIRPTAGRIEWNGVDITRRSTEQIVAAGIVHIPQGDLPFPAMTVLDNLLLGAYSPAAWPDRYERLERVYHLFPRLSQATRQLAGSLSGGERRMLAIGRGIMGKARLLMIDEPSLGLAPLVIEQVYAAIREIRASGVALLLVDENAEHAAGLANPIYLIEGGSLVHEGPAKELLQEALLSTYLG